MKNKEQKSRRPQKPHKAAPSYNGLVSCQKGHQWTVRDLNTELRAVKCPVCGGYTDILQGTGTKK